MAAKAFSTLAPMIPAQLANRKEVEALIEGLIAFLDDSDGDADFEAVNEDGGDILDEPHDRETEDGV